MNPTPNRRTFVKQSSLGAAVLATGPLLASAKSLAAVAGANDAIRVSIWGCKRRFRPIVEAIAAIPNIRVHSICDVNAKNLDASLAIAEENLGYRPKTETDLRRLAESPELDAVFIILPDHWHAYASYLALENGKHVYVEKPCSHNPREGELYHGWMEKYGKVIQMGNQQRSAPESIDVIEQIHGGVIGEPYLAKAFYANARPRVPLPQEVPVPDHLDWELFQGPAPRRPFWDIIEDYNWHWYWHWGTAETGNNAAHELDIARWALQVTYPEQVSCLSGKYHYPDDGMNVYDTMDATFRFSGGKAIQWDGKSRNRFATYGAGRGVIVYGTEGSAFIDRNGYRIHNRNGQLVSKRETAEKVDGTALGGAADSTQLHVQNFFDSIRGKAEQNSPIDEGSISTQLCHYANISARENDAPILLDPETGRLKDRKLMKKYWSREYEPGWEPKA